MGTDNILPNDRVVLITGASSGIGAAVAAHFARKGATLSLTGRNEANLQATAAECVKNGLNMNRIVLSIGDITNKNFRQQLVQDTIGAFGRIDVLVNNAGAVIDKSSCALGAIDKLQDMIECNLMSAIHLSQLCLPHLIKVKGNIVNVSSVAGIRPCTGFGMYALTKSALDQFTQCLALEMGPKCVRVNSVNPGAVDTPIFQTRGIAIPIEYHDDFLRVMGGTLPMQRTGKSDEIARAVGFLADNTEAGWITGHLMTIDGGYTLTNGSAMTFDALQMAFHKGGVTGNGTNGEHIEDDK